MRNYLTISPNLSTEQLDISNIFTVAALFCKSLNVSENEWDKWGFGAFRPFAPLISGKFSEWTKENLPFGNVPKPPTDFHGEYRIRWMSDCNYLCTFNKFTALIVFPQYATNWHLTLVCESPKTHQLFLWDPVTLSWAEFCLDRHIYRREDQALIYLLHAWIDW